MLVCSMAPNVYAPTKVHREPVTLDNALMVALETARSKCAEGLGTSTSSTLMHTRLQLMTLDVEALHRTPTTKGGLKTWAIVTYQQPLQLLLQLQEKFLVQVRRITNETLSIVFPLSLHKLSRCAGTGPSIPIPLSGVCIGFI